MLDKTDEIIEAALAYALIALTGYLSYVAVTGPDTELDILLAFGLLGMAYVLLHGVDAFTSAIRAWRGLPEEQNKGDDDE